jgi:hypothetical protein
MSLVKFAPRWGIGEWNKYSPHTAVHCIAVALQLLHCELEASSLVSGLWAVPPAQRRRLSVDVVGTAESCQAAVMRACAASDMWNARGKASPRMMRASYSEGWFVPLGL